MVWRRMFLFLFLLLLLAINHGLMRPALNQSRSEIGPTSYGKPIRLSILTLTSFLPGIVHTRLLKIRNKILLKRNAMTFQIIPLTAHSGHSQNKLLEISLTLHFPLSSVPMALLHLHQWIKQPKFASNSSLDDSRATPPVNLPLSNHVLPNFFLSTRDVQSALAVLDVRKAHGPDGIPAILLRNCSWELTPILCKLFRLILKSNIFPSPWKHAVVQPVPKKGDPSDPANYRPIAITSIISKVFESLINIKLSGHLKTHNLLSDHQYGFRSSRSCGDLLAYVSYTWASSLKDYGESVAIALDISKAFDIVWHRQLIAKLPSFGFTPNICKLNTSFLSNWSIVVRVDGHSSPSLMINSGVPQGSFLSPTLFLLFINDPLSTTTNLIHAYADDSTLHVSSGFRSAPGPNNLLIS